MLYKRRGGWATAQPPLTDVAVDPHRRDHALTSLRSGQRPWRSSPSSPKGHDCSTPAPASTWRRSRVGADGQGGSSPLEQTVEENLREPGQGPSTRAVARPSPRCDPRPATATRTSSARGARPAGFPHPAHPPTADVAGAHLHRLGRSPAPTHPLRHRRHARPRASIAAARPCSAWGGQHGGPPVGRATTASAKPRSTPGYDPRADPRPRRPSSAATTASSPPPASPTVSCCGGVHYDRHGCTTQGRWSCAHAPAPCAGDEARHRPRQARHLSPPSTSADPGGRGAGPRASIGAPAPVGAGVTRRVCKSRLRTDTPVPRRAVPSRGAPSHFPRRVDALGRPTRRSRRAEDRMKVGILAGGLGTRLAEGRDRAETETDGGGSAAMPILWHIMRYYHHFGFRRLHDRPRLPGPTT